VAGWIHTEINVRHRELNPDTVAHLSTNRARRRLSSLIEANAQITTPDQPTQSGATAIRTFVVFHRQFDRLCCYWYLSQINGSVDNIIIITTIVRINDNKVAKCFKNLRHVNASNTFLKFCLIV